jgi:hypothetical protein
MNPTLHEPEIIEIMPYGSSPLQVGDVAYFFSPETDRLVIHRIVRVTREGISTLGDNNACKDAFLLKPKNIKGQVVAAWQGQKRRKIAGGLRGKLAGSWLHWQHALDQGISSWLHPLYQALSNRDLITRILSASLRPQVVVFNARGQNQFRILLGQRIIGQYDDVRQRWQIRRPFRLLVNERTLPRPQQSARLDQPIITEWQ